MLVFSQKPAIVAQLAKPAVHITIICTKFEKNDPVKKLLYEAIAGTNKFNDWPGGACCL